MWKFNSKNTINIYAVFLLLAGIIFRIFGFADLPLMHDELSAWSRLQFSGIGEVISKGVAPDGHPALIQVFLYFYTSIFGDAEWVLKFPFFLMGIASMWLFYKVANEIFGERNALISLSIFSASQFIIVYSLISRPYISGIFLSLLAVKYWLRIIQTEKSTLKNYLIFAVLLALMAYNHYFSGLFAILLWLSTWLYFKKLNLRSYLITTILAALLFLPHLNITLGQLALGGIGGEDGWLSAPDVYFIINFFLFGFNYSFLIIGIIVFVVFANFFIRNSEKENIKLRLIFIAWFGFSFAIGYIYSVKINPVIQNSMLIFTFPFFITGIFGKLKGQSAVYKVLPLVIVVILGFELIVNRHHYQIMDKQPFKTISSTLLGFDKEDQVFAYVNHQPAYLNYYIKERKLNFEYINNYSGEYGISSIADSIFNSSAEIFYTDGSNEMLNTLIRLKYPVIAERQDGFTFTGYIFKKSGTSAVNIKTLQNYSKDTLISQEYFNLMHLELSDPDINFSDNISARVSFDAELPDDIKLVFDFSKGEEVLHWSAANSTSERVIYNKQTRLAQNRCLWDIFSNHKQLDGAELKIFLWNPSKKNYNLNSFQIELIPGNPNYYGMQGERPD